MQNFNKIILPCLTLIHFIFDSLSIIEYAGDNTRKGGATVGVITNGLNKKTLLYHFLFGSLHKKIDGYNQENKIWGPGREKRGEIAFCTEYGAEPIGKNI